MNITKPNNRQQQQPVFPSSQAAALYNTSTMKNTRSWAQQHSHHFHFPNDHHRQVQQQQQRDHDYHLMVSWPPVSYTCSFCRREFRSAQALGGHMNVHRRDRARLRSSSSSTTTTTSSSLDYSPPNSSTTKSLANYNNSSLNLNLDPNNPNPTRHRTLITSNQTLPLPAADSSPNKHFTFNPNMGGLISTSAINRASNYNNPPHGSSCGGSDTMERIRVEKRRGGGPFDPKNFLAVRSSSGGSGVGGNSNFTTKNMIRGVDNCSATQVGSYKRSDETGHFKYGLLEDSIGLKKKNGMISEYLKTTQIGLGSNGAFGDNDDDELEFMNVDGEDDQVDLDLELRLGYSY